MSNILQKLYLQQICELYSAETQLLDALPEMASHASDPALRRKYLHQFDETQDQVERLRVISQRHGCACGDSTCEAMRDLIREAKSNIYRSETRSERDAVLTTFVKRIKLYEIARCVLVKDFADFLGFVEDHDLLDETPDGERPAYNMTTRSADGARRRSAMNKAASGVY